MQNFKIFSFILAVIVLIMVGQVVFSDYVPEWVGSESDNLKTDIVNKLGADVLKTDTSNSNESEIVYHSDENTNPTLSNTSPIMAVIEETPEAVIVDNDVNTLQTENNFVPQIILDDTNSVIDFEDINPKAIVLNPYLRDEQLKSAGFLTASLQEESFNDLYFKSVYIGDILSVMKKKYVIKDDALLYAKVYVLSPDVGNDVLSIYSSLKEKAKSSLNSTINETNQFGKASFYLNDSTRSDTAFLTVRYQSLIYGFSYPKVYHKQVSNLIKLIGLEK